jgi:hypothetical protein
MPIRIRDHINPGSGMEKICSEILDPGLTSRIRNTAYSHIGKLFVISQFLLKDYGACRVLLFNFFPILKMVI